MKTINQINDECERALLNIAYNTQRIKYNLSLEYKKVRKEQKKEIYLKYINLINFILNFELKIKHFDRRFLYLMFGGYNQTTDYNLMSKDIMNFISLNRTKWEKKKNVTQL
jgi:hypothetical protein